MEKTIEGIQPAQKKVCIRRVKSRGPFAAFTLALAFGLTSCGGGGELEPTTFADTDSSGIDFGDDSSQWANDDECDDPRFEGPGVHSILLDEDLLADATDCRTLFEAGQITLR